MTETTISARIRERLGHAPSDEELETVAQLLDAIADAPQVDAVLGAEPFATLPPAAEAADGTGAVGEDDQTSASGPPGPSISMLSRLIEAGEVSPTNLLEACLARIQSDNGMLRCFITVMAETARTEATAAEERAQRGHRLGPIDGIPIAVKDVIASGGTRTTAGSAILADFVPSRDATALAALRSAGAIIVGKTNLHEFAYGVTSDNPWFGPVLNPRDRARLPGGSSGGSAAAVAAGMAVAAVGTDTGGSVRIPAAACALVGLKPTYGRVSCQDVIPQAWSLDHVGPLTSCVADARLLLEALIGGALRRCEARADAWRVAVPPPLASAAAPDVRGAFARSLADLQDLGAELVERDLPELDAAQRAWLVILLAESAAYHQRHLERCYDQIGSDVRPFLLAGALIESGRYVAALRFRRMWQGRMIEALADVDIIATPTLPAAVPLRTARSVATGHGEMRLRDAMVFYQWPANLLGWPSISLPTPYRADGLPVSIMLTGKPHAECRLLGMAERLEASFPTP